MYKLILATHLHWCWPDCAEYVDVEDDKNKEGKKASEGEPEPIYVVSAKCFLSVSTKFFFICKVKYFLDIIEIYEWFER